MTELDLIERLQKKASTGRRSRIVLGIGDDCSIVRGIKPGEEFLYTTDLLVEDVHFHRDTHSAAAIGHKALARGLSDIAAMGGSPRLCLLSLALPKWAGRNWIDSFYRGFLRLADDTGTELAGGDLSSAERMVCDVAVCGTVPRGEALRRDRARSGEAIYVSGTLGGSSLGLQSKRGAAWRRHRKPEPRLELGAYLRKRLRARSAIDLSDGLSIDLHRLAKASGAAACINRPLPVFHGASLEQALHGGEDYELLFTIRPGNSVPRCYKGLQLTRIGTIVKGQPGKIDFFGWPLTVSGYDHFRKSSSLGPCNKQT